MRPSRPMSMPTLSDLNPRRGLLPPLTRLALTLALAVAVGCPLCVRGAAYAFGSLDLNGVTLTPSVGTVSWAPWSLNAFSSAANSDGTVDIESGAGATSASASASVPYAQAASSAAVSGSGTLSGQISGTVNIPSGIIESASVGNSGNYSSWQSTFSIVGGSGVESVNVGALLSSTLKSITDSMGWVLQNDDIFTLNINGNNVLSFNDSLPAGPSQNLSSIQDPVNFSQAVSLDSGLTHTIFISINVEQEAEAVPDQTSSLLLLGLGLGVLVAGKHLRGLRGTSPAWLN